jgi:hypothetical protein
MFRDFRLTQLYFNSFYYFIQIIRHMFQSYDHLRVKIYTSEINMLISDVQPSSGENIYTGN